MICLLALKNNEQIHQNYKEILDYIEKKLFVIYDKFE